MKFADGGIDRAVPSRRSPGELDRVTAAPGSRTAEARSVRLPVRSPEVPIDKVRVNVRAGMEEGDEEADPACLGLVLVSDCDIVHDDVRAALILGLERRSCVRQTNRGCHARQLRPPASCNPPLGIVVGCHGPELHVRMQGDLLGVSDLVEMAVALVLKQREIRLDRHALCNGRGLDVGTVRDGRGR